MEYSAGSYIQSGVWHCRIIYQSFQSHFDRFMVCARPKVTCSWLEEGMYHVTMDRKLNAESWCFGEVLNICPRVGVPSFRLFKPLVMKLFHVYLACTVLAQVWGMFVSPWIWNLTPRAGTFKKNSLHIELLACEVSSCLKQIRKSLFRKLTFCILRSVIFSISHFWLP